QSLRMSQRGQGLQEIRPGDVVSRNDHVSEDTDRCRTCQYPLTGAPNVPSPGRNRPLSETARYPHLREHREYPTDHTSHHPADRVANPEGVMTRLLDELREGRDLHAFDHDEMVELAA